MDPSGLDLSFNLDPGLAAQMGFASFGAQPSLKKRKYNPSTDAVVSICSFNERGKNKQEQNRGSGQKGAGSDGNSVPLGVRKVEDHDRGDDARNTEDVMGGMRKLWGVRYEEEGGEGGARDRGRKRGKSETKDEDTNDKESVDEYSRDDNTHADSDHTAQPVIIPLPLLPPSLPSQPKSNDSSGGIHDFTPTNTNSATTTITLIPLSITSATTTPPPPPLLSTQATYRTHPASNPAMPTTCTADIPVPVIAASTLPPGPVHQQANGAGRSHEMQEQKPEPKPKPKQKQGTDWWALRKGVRDDRGDVAYYDQSFVEDPWEELVRSRGQDRGK